MGHCLSRLDRERSRSLPFIGVVDPKANAQSIGNRATGSSQTDLVAMQKKASLSRDGYLQHPFSVVTGRDQRALVAQMSSNSEYRSSPTLPASSSRGSGVEQQERRFPNSTINAYSYHSGGRSAPDHHHRNGGQRTVVAMYNYENRVDGDIGFEKGDLMALIDDSNTDWWYVRHPKSGFGYAPRNFLALVDSLESEEWYAGRVTRSAAEKLVLAPNLPRGTFLVRKRSDAGESEYALTIKDARDSECEVKHYKIRPLDESAGFYITAKKIFPTIRDLVDYYSMAPNGLCYRLTFPAPRIAPTRPDLCHDTAKNWEIAREELQLIRKLGDGNFGEVWLGEWRGCVEVAIKTMKAGSSMTIEAFLAEAQIMKRITHPKLVKLYAVCTTSDPLFIITEYMIHGSLLHYLRKNSDVLTLQALVDMSAQVASGMAYLEGRKLVHRDLAARNVLVGEVISGIPEVKVADFGLARRLLEENVYEAQTGAKFPIKWTAPEAAQCGNFTPKSDVWSYAILLYEVFTFGHTPYPGMQNREVIEEVERGYRMPRPLNAPPPIYDEMLKCWARNPDDRPTFDYLFSYFDDYFVSCQPNYVPPSVDGGSELDAVEGRRGR